MIVVNKQQFKSALAKAGILASNLPSGDKIRFNAEGGKAAITASNGASLGVFYIDCEGADQIAFVTEAKRLSIINTLRGDPALRLEAGRLVIEQGETSTRIPVEPPEALAIDGAAPATEGGFEVEAAKLKRLFAQVAYARDTKDGLFANYSFGSDGRSLFARATNSRIAARASFGLETGIAPFEATLSPIAAAMIEALEDTPVKIALGQDRLELASERLRAFIHYPDGKFPADQADALINNGDTNARFAIAKDAMMESLGIFLGSDAKDLAIAKDGDSIILASDNGISSVRDRIPLVESEGVDFKFALDLAQCRAIFNSLRDAPALSFAYNAPESPLRFTDNVGMAGVVTTLIG